MPLHGGLAYTANVLQNPIHLARATTTVEGPWRRRVPTEFATMQGEQCPSFWMSTDTAATWMSTLNTAATTAIGLVALGAFSCSHPAPSATPSQDRLPALRVWSAAGWGCPVPPFRREGCDQATQTEADPASCFILPRLPEQTSGWSFPRVGAQYYRMTGSFAPAAMTHADWYAAQGVPMPEGTCTEQAFPVFDVESWCIELHVDQLDADDRELYADELNWIRDHTCS